MAFVQRDSSGVVCAVFQQRGDSVTEELPMHHPDIVAFLQSADATATAIVDLAQSDAAMARVIEDLIEVLVSKGVMNYDDLPGAARAKLTRRQEWRGGLEEALEVFGGGKII